MSLFYITGVAGSGKSTVLKALENKGYEVHDADEKFSSWEHKITRKRIDSSPDHRPSTNPKFFEEHDWYIDIYGVRELAQSASNKTIFLCGSVANEDEVWSYFDKVFCLHVDDETLMRRIHDRTNKDFGKSKHEIEHLIHLNNDVIRKYTSLGAVLIDTSMSPGIIVDTILKQL